jgi:uncharacterized membrane protein
LGPVELIVLGFPGSHFNGAILPALADLVERDVIQIIDALLVQKDAAGDVTLVEIEEEGTSEAVTELSALVREARDLITDEDVEELVAGLEPGSSAAMLVFEHTWAKPFKDAVLDSGGLLLADLHIPASVVDEVLAAATDS